MTRKDYEGIAKAISEVCFSGLLGQAQKERLVTKIADYCEKDNPDFIRGKFFAACFKTPDTT